jgi:virulence-associated protein VapD
MKRKLSARTKQEIKQNFKKLKKSDYSGEALTYLNRVKGAAKARAAKAKQYIQVGTKQVKKNSQLGKIITKAAEIRGTSVKEYIKEDIESVEKLDRNYRETSEEKAIDDLAGIIENRGNTKIFVNEEKFSEIEAIYEIEDLRNKIRRVDKSIMQILVKYEVDLKGNLYFKVPEVPEVEEGEDLEDFQNYFEDFDITVIVSERTKDKPEPKTRLKKRTNPAKVKKSKGKSKTKKKK